jgi:hypothetical protein
MACGTLARLKTRCAAKSTSDCAAGIARSSQQQKYTLPSHRIAESPEFRSRKLETSASGQRATEIVDPLALAVHADPGSGRPQRFDPLPGLKLRSLVLEISGFRCFPSASCSASMPHPEHQCGHMPSTLPATLPQQAAAGVQRSLQIQVIQTHQRQIPLRDCPRRVVQARRLGPRICA